MNMPAFTQFIAQAETSPSGIWAWLLDLDFVDVNAGNTHFGWEHPIPNWVWFLLILGVMTIAGFSYRHISGKRTGRLILSGVRSIFILFVVVMICGPMLILPQTQVEQDHVLFLVDRSRSMTVADVDTDATNRITREEQLLKILKENEPVFKDLEEQHILNLFGFSDNIQSLNSLDITAKPAGQATALRTAINDAIENTRVRVQYALPPIVELAKDGPLTHAFAANTPIPVGATHLIVFTKNEYGEMLAGVSAAI